MNYKQAITLLKELEKKGYHRYHSGLVRRDVPKRFGGNTTGSEWGINIDGRGTMDDPTGCPRIIWCTEEIPQT